MSVYNEEFYKNQCEGSYRSAKIVLDKALSILPQVNSVIDVGCGVGTWLKAWQEIRGGGGESNPA